jgi:hypothetical protein
VAWPEAARQPLGEPGAPAARVRAVVRSALRDRHSAQPVRHSGYAAGAWPVLCRLRAASELAHFSVAAAQARGSVGPVVSAEQAAALRPAALDAAAVPQPEAAWAALAVLQREGPGAAEVLLREGLLGAAALPWEGLPSVVPPWAAPWVFRPDRVLRAPAPQPAARFVRGMEGLPMAAP